MPPKKQHSTADVIDVIFGSSDENSGSGLESAFTSNEHKEDSAGDTEPQETESLSSLFVQRDISAELKSLSDLVNQQGTTLLELKSELLKMQKENTAQETELSDMKTRLAVSEQEVENLKKENTVLENRLTASKNATKNLIKENAERPKVAFSAALTDSGTVGPFSVQTQKVITNVGKAYNSNTGPANPNITALTVIINKTTICNLFVIFY
uniref:Uncharacterized protein n=1 Tax=Astyanax mexicanus TaxID=7994 RepID=A0A8B9RBJ3_ASTMX